MSKQLKDILSNANKDITEQELLNYLANKLTDDERYILEKNMANDAFINDAVEGLQEIRSKDKLALYVEQLNNDLHKKINLKKKRRNKLKWKDQPHNYIAIIIILTLLIVCFIIIKKIV